MDFLKIAGKDIKIIFKNRFIRVCVIAIIVVPLLYSLLYLKAFWDPYSKLVDMPVAVVNLDEGTVLDGETVKYGEGIVESLKSNDSVGWKFVSQEDADKGLEGDKYYAKFEITKDFSKKVVSAKLGAPTQAGLKFVCNEKKNFLASQVNSKVESALKALIVEKISNNYVKASFDTLYTVKDGMRAAADGSGELKDGLQTLNSSVPALEDGVNKLNDGSNKLYNGQTALNSGITQLNNGLGELNSKSALLSSGLSNLNAGSVNLAAGASNLYKGYTEKLYPGISGLNLEISGLKEKLDNGTATLSSVSATINGINIKLTGLIEALDCKSSEVDKTIGITEGITNLNVGAKQLNVGLQGLNSQVPILTGGINKLYNGSTDALAGSNKLVDGQTQLKDGISTLSGKVPELKNGVTKLYDGSIELSTKLSDGSTKLSSGLVNTSEDMGKFVSSPVELKIEPINAVPNYGTGFAPYFINLSLWIGAIMMFFVITTKTEEHSESTRFAKAFGKYLSFGFVGVLQAVLVGIAVLLLGLSPNNIPLYFASIIFCSLVYIAIVQCLISLFGDAGRLLSIVLLILQLTACAGTFPLELVPHLFVVLNPLMPFTYSVEALREITSATVINYSVVLNDLVILGAMLVGFLTVSIVFHTLGEKMLSVIEGKKEEAM